MTGMQRFTEGLAALGYAFQQDGDRVWFPIEILAGRFKGKTVSVGIVVPSDFSLNPPTGPHINPRLIPLNPSVESHARLAESKFGSDWGYLSRPFQKWNATDKTVKDYLRWVRHLLHTL